MCRLLMCLFFFVLVLAMPAWAWEFNADGNTEGWQRYRSYIDVNDGYLLVTAPQDMAGVRITSPVGPYDTNEVTGIYFKMLPSLDVSALAGETFRFYTPQTAYTEAFELTGDPNQPEVVYLDLSSNSDWNGQPIEAVAIDLPGAPPEDYQMKVDWVRMEGLYLENESFEYWDFVNAKIVGWTVDAGYYFPDPMEPETVNSRDYAAVLNGTGSGESMTQDIKGGLDMAKGKQIFLTAAFKVPTGSWDENAKIVLKVGEEGPDGWNEDPEPITVDTFDAFFEASTVYTLQNEPNERQALVAQLTITSPAGSVIYVDDIFADVLAEPVEPNPDMEYGWPINCVKLAEGQEITIDGIVTPEEYAGAQVVVFNTETANGVDPHDPNIIHEANPQQPHWLLNARTPLEDYNATYYIMWDDDNLYVAVSVQDDSYTFDGPYPNRADCLQFTLSESPSDVHVPNQYIPTVAARDADGNPIAKNDFGANWYAYNIFQHSEVLYDGHVDDETQDWQVELKIPWIILIGDFLGDLANGDADGDGKNVFPPEQGDQVGFTLQPRDWDTVDGTAAIQLSASTQGWMFPWSGALPRHPLHERLNFVGPAE